MAAKKPFSFKSSKLSSAVDPLWSASKGGFKAEEASIKLDLGKTLGNEKSVDPAKASNLPTFVFGSKITERIVTSDQSDSDKEKEKKQKDVDQPKSISTVFEKIQEEAATSSFISNERRNSDDESATTSTKLRESAQEEESKRDVKSAAPQAKVEVYTGEEGETNVFNAQCKLHAFDMESKAWTERGIASLRINRKISEYRIVARIKGNQRVVINSRIFPDMVLEKISSKRIKFSATTQDSDLPILFLITATDFTTEQLFAKLSEILNEVKTENCRKRRPSDGQKEEAVEAKKPAVEIDETEVETVELKEDGSSGEVETVELNKSSNGSS
ncbi:hypothetical protein AB6A40_008282 [Gnathostoma spinigerum]|uniref:RanBD1 domain-containing protein n=1 Tax=Gnathostoma spinigerum TaxID=75299 RepID=A0ABD6ENX8_9BILA